jgi:hypothetical protein
MAMKQLWRVAGFSVFLILATSFFHLPKGHVVARIPEYNPDIRDIVYLARPLQ